MKKAIELAGSPRMKDLPGYVPETEADRPKKVKDCLELYRKMKFKRL